MYSWLFNIICIPNTRFKRLSLTHTNGFSSWIKSPWFWATASTPRKRQGCDWKQRPSGKELSTRACEEKKPKPVSTKSLSSPCSYTWKKTAIRGTSTGFIIQCPLPLKLPGVNSLSSLFRSPVCLLESQFHCSQSSLQALLSVSVSGSVCPRGECT